MLNNVSMELKFAFYETISYYDDIVDFMLHNEQADLRGVIRDEIPFLQWRLLDRGVRTSLVNACLDFLEDRFAPAAKQIELEEWIELDCKDDDEDFHFCEAELDYLNDLI